MEAKPAEKKIIRYLLREKPADLFFFFWKNGRFPGHGQIIFLSRRGQIIYFQCPHGQKIYFQKVRAPPTQNQMFAP